MWWVIAFLSILLYGKTETIWAPAALVAGWLICLHIRNLYVRRYMKR